VRSQQAAVLDNTFTRRARVAQNAATTVLQAGEPSAAICTFTLLQ
jgi:hypothetical protein